MKHLLQRINQPTSIAPLIVFRMVFGAVMLVSMVRFMLKGWVYEQYIKPQFYFPYFGFEWIRPLPPAAMYVVFIGMALAALGILLGSFYRYSATAFFLLFTYVELIDKTNYLNHYYFVSLVSFLLIWVPAGRGFSLDVWREPASACSHVPVWMIGMFQLQLGIVYFYAGLAKINTDWLLEALPLKIWLPVHTDLPLIGPLMQYAWVAYAFSWFGALYDLTVPFLLLYRQTRPWAYAAVVVFHITTWLLFPIGMFPFIMIGLTLIFFPARFHESLIDSLKRLISFVKHTLMRGIMVGEDTDHGDGRMLSVFTDHGDSNEDTDHGDKDRKQALSPVLCPHKPEQHSTIPGLVSSQTGTVLSPVLYPHKPKPAALSPVLCPHKPEKNKAPYAHFYQYVLAMFFVWQLLFPWRFLLYPGELFWTEQGYRFSWRVMLMEKAGYVTFHVKDPATGGESEVSASEYLTPNQEKMMATQPDMILQFAHFIRDQYRQQGIEQPIVQAEAYVTLNGRGSRLFLDPDVNLAKMEDGWQHKSWIIAKQPYTAAQAQ